MFDEKMRKEDEELKLAEEKKAKEDPQNHYYINPPPPQPREKFDLYERKVNKTIQKHLKEKIEEANQDKEESKKKSKEDDKNVEDANEKDKEVEEYKQEFQRFMEFETDDDYGENLKNCQKILTVWEVSNRGYTKINESYIFEPLNNTIEFSSDGKYFIMSANDSKTFIIYDAQTLTRLDKIILKATDSNGNDITCFYSAQLSKDGSYIITGDSYMRYIFERNGKFIRSLSGKNMYTIYQFSNTEFVG